MKIYGDMISGNCFKIKLVASFLDLTYEWVHIDIMNGEARTEEFLSKNPNAKVPILELENGRYISESNAIVDFLAFGSYLYPEDNFMKAKILEWQFFEQYSHEPFIAVARFIAKFQGMPEGRKKEYESKQEGGKKALSVMEEQLSKTKYLVGNNITVADISLYAYTHVSHEGGFSLEKYPKVKAWLQRIASHPKYVGME